MTVKPFLKKTVKFFFWLFACVILLFTVLALLLQVPSVQNFAAQKTTDYLQQKTKTHVSLDRINIKFPKSISLTNFLLLDRQNDTLVFAGTLDVSINMLTLLKSEINISGISLSNANATLKRKENDSTYNYNFLIEAFQSKKSHSDTSKKATPDLNIDELELENIRFSIEDNLDGILLETKVNNFTASIETIDVDNFYFHAENLKLDGFTGSFVQFKKQESKSIQKTKSPNPLLVSDEIEIRNSSFKLTNKIEKEASAFHIGYLNINSTSIDLKTENLKINKLELDNSYAHLSMRSAKDSVAEALPNASTAEKKNKWRVSVAEVNLKNNAFKYVDSSILSKNDSAFDVSNLNITGINLDARTIFYSSDLTQIDIRNFQINSHNKFKIDHLSGTLKMTNRFISAENLAVRTAKSHLQTTASLSFNTLAEAKKNPQSVKFDINVHQISLYHPEMIYFVPALKKEQYLSEQIYTGLKTRIQGRLDDFTAKNLSVTTAASTKLYANIHVKGLPDLKKMELTIPDLYFESNKQDISQIAGKRIPKNIELPDSVKLSAAYSGSLKNFESNLHLNTSFGSVNMDAQLAAGNQYDISADLKDFNVAKLLKNVELPEIVDGTVNITGSGMDTNTVNAKVATKINRLRINEYTYKNLEANIAIHKKSLAGTVSLRDEYAELDLSGKTDFNAGQKHIEINLDLKGADLMKLNLAKQDLRIAFKAVADLRGSDVNNVNGTAGVTGIILSKSGKKYILDSLMFVAINENNNNNLKIKSAVVGINYKGTFAPAKLAAELKQTLNNYLPVDTNNKKINTTPQNFELEVELNNHPVVSEVFLPELKAFEPGKIKASYVGAEKKLTATIEIKRLHYGELELNDFKSNLNGDQQKLVYRLTAEKISNADLSLNKLITEGVIENKVASTHLSAEDDKGREKINLSTSTRLTPDAIKITIDKFALLQENWDLSKDNYILTGKSGLNIHNLLMSKNESSIRINSASENLNSDIAFDITNIKLEDFSSIFQKDTVLIGGIMNGKVQMKRSNKSWGIISDFKISRFQFREINLGELSLEADNYSGNQFDVDLRLTGEGNALHAYGNFKPQEKRTDLDIKFEFRPLKMKLLEAFSMGQITNTEGGINGTIDLAGTIKEPEIKGEFNFVEARMNPFLLNSPLYMKNEKIVIDNNGLHLKSFTILDKNMQPAIINGSIYAKNLRDIKFDINMKTNDFLLLNTVKNTNADYYGTLVVDSKIKLRGTPAHPVISSSVKLKNKSYFTFAVPESKLTTDKGEGVVLFIDSTKFNPILTRNQKKEEQKSTIRNLDISSTIEIDKRAILKLMLDPASEDSLVVRGSAALSFALDPSGKISLTGLYNVEDGSYMVSMENLLKRQFRISPGSTITWNGDPLDATINLNAYYSIRTSPVDLVADQLPPSERNQFRQRFPFLVNLHLKGALLAPEISFEIQLPPSDRGAMNGMLHARLEQLKENPNALNKQVFALLVLGRFIQENPLETEGSGGTEAAARTTVGNFLSAQLNKLTSNAVPGVDINFDVQSYDDYSTGNAQGRTEVGVGVSKQLFNDRVSVQVGGSVDVEGERAKQNTATDIAGDVTVEYKITKDGRYRLKGFRLNQYTGALEGQLIQTGAGLLYTRDFESWLQLITKEVKEKKENDSINVESSVNEK